MNKQKNKNRDAQKKRSSNKVCEVSPEAGTESMVKKICERGWSWDGSEGERELWMVSGELTECEDVVGAWINRLLYTTLKTNAVLAFIQCLNKF